MYNKTISEVLEYKPDNILHFAGDFFTRPEVGVASGGHGPSRTKVPRTKLLRGRTLGDFPFSEELIYTTTSTTPRGWC